MAVTASRLFARSTGGALTIGSTATSTTMRCGFRLSGRYTVVKSVISMSLLVRVYFLIQHR